MNYEHKGKMSLRSLDICVFIDIIIIAVADAGLCKGSTTDSDSVCEGSNPSPATIFLKAGRIKIYASGFEES